MKNQRDSFSIDRINSDLGYTYDNINIVSSFVNWMKLDLSEESFLEIIRKIYDYKIGNNRVNTEPLLYKLNDSKLKEMIRIAKKSAKYRKNIGRETCGEFNIDFEYIRKMIITQNNRCLFTGMSFKWYDICNDPFQASIDRIDNDKGYIRGNVQIIAIVSIK